MTRVVDRGQAPPNHPIYRSGAMVTAGGFRLPATRYHGSPGATAFWVGGFDVWAVERSHIRTVMDHPERFGVGPQDVIERYRLYGEKPGTEGRARREIISELCEAGWIRIRHHTGKEDYWCVTFHDAGHRRLHLRRFLNLAQKELGLHREADFKIEELGSGTVCWYRFADGGVGAYLAGGKPSCT